MACSTTWARGVMVAVLCASAASAMDPNAGAVRPPYFPDYYGYHRFDNMSWSQIVDNGLKSGVSQGIASTISDAMRTVLNEVVVAPVKRFSSCVRSGARFVSDKLHDSPGLTAAAVLNYKTLFDRDFSQFIVALMTDVRFVRAAVLDMGMPAASAASQGAPYGIAQFKQNLEYLRGRLAQHLVHYRVQPGTVDPTFKRAHAVACNVANTALVAAAVHAAWAFMFGASAPAPAVPQMNNVHRLVEEVLAPVRPAPAQADPSLLMRGVGQVYAHPYKTLLACSVARMALCMNRSSLLRADHTLSGVDRSLVCMLLESLMQHCDHLSGLCDRMNGEGAVASLKSELERSAKHASETFVQLAQVLDAEQAAQLQRNKPGQMGTFGQTGYLQNTPRPFFE